MKIEFKLPSLKTFLFAPDFLLKREDYLQDFTHYLGFGFLPNFAAPDLVVSVFSAAFLSAFT